MNSTGSSTFGLLAILCASVCFAVVNAQSSWIEAAENASLAFVSALSPKDASGRLHIVEVDATSIAAVGSWPWPRDHYARLVRQLDDAGARSIVFDIDFSSRSTPAGDVAFAQALAETNASIVLPTFSQTASEHDAKFLDSLPIPELRENVSLASASVRPDGDALVRSMLYGTVTRGAARPSISAQISGAAGSAHSSFRIDFGIRPSSIPRHSFGAVERGEFSRRELAGKDVIVGATAIELGDRYGVPNHGVIPGVTIQAIAAETLIAGAFRELGWVPLLLLSTIGGIVLARRRTYHALYPATIAFCAIIIGCQIAGYHLLRVVLETMPAIIALAAVCLGQTLRIGRRQLWQKSVTDAETGLPNALAFSRSDRRDEQFIVTAYIKDFDAIQAVIGKGQVGALVERLVERIRTVAQIETIFRADTRILAWEHPDDFDTVTAAFETLTNAMHKPIEVAGRRIDVALAFGISASGDLAGASRAASHAAEQGETWHAHEDAEKLILEQRVSLMGELEDALDTGDLEVFYQPKLCLGSGRIESVEALVRWEHPVRGFLRPDLFIPLAEETNRIEPLTLFVLRESIANVVRLRSEGITISAAVNISAKLIGSERFVQAAERILRKSGAPRDQIIFEVTESAAMADPERSARNLRRLRELGIAISLDDYGTGQSTLSYLKMFPFTELKIDRAFVQHAHEERSDALLVNSTIQLAHSLGLRVVGEGVEDAECLEFLKRAGCDYAQGYFIAKPLTADDLFELVRNMRIDDAA